MTLQDRLMARIERIPESGCWIWLGCVDTAKGYGFIGSGMEAPKVLKTHRASWLLFRGEIPEGLQVLHHCDVTCCVNPYHLFLGTNQDNVDDKVRKGRGGLAKITPEEVEKVRSLCLSGLPQRDVADMFGISQTQVSRITLKKRWKHI